MSTGLLVCGLVGVYALWCWIDHEHRKWSERSRTDWYARKASVRARAAERAHALSCEDVGD